MQVYYFYIPIRLRFSHNIKLNVFNTVPYHFLNIVHFIDLSLQAMQLSRYELTSSQVPQNFWETEGEFGSSTEFLMSSALR